MHSKKAGDPDKRKMHMHAIVYIIQLKQVRVYLATGRFLLAASMLEQYNLHDGVRVLPEEVDGHIKSIILMAELMVTLRLYQAGLGYVNDGLAYLSAYLLPQLLIMNRLMNSTSDVGSLEHLPADCKHLIVSKLYEAM